MRGLLLSLLLSLTLPACGYLSRWPAPGRAREDLSRLLAERSGEKTFWADGRLRAERGGRGISFPAEIFIEFPRRARLTAFGLFDRPEAYLTSDGETLSLYLPEQNRFHRGKAQGPQLASLLGLPSLELEEVLLLLSGRVPLAGERARDTELSRDRWHGWWKASLEEPPLALFFTMGGSRITGFEKGRGAGRVQVSFENFRGPTRASAEYPRKIDLRASGSGARLKAAWSEIEVDTPADVPFTLEPPAGLPVLPLAASTLVWER